MSGDESINRRSRDRDSCRQLNRRSQWYDRYNRYDTLDNNRVGIHLNDEARWHLRDHTRHRSTPINFSNSNLPIPVSYSYPN